MKKGIFLLFVLGLFSFQPQKAKITLEIKGIKKSEGKVYIAAFRKTDAFPAMEGKFKSIIVNAKTSLTEAVMEIPADTYSIAVFHDANNNGKLDKNMFGVPTEIYGFSNNARGTFSAPSFEAAAFELKDSRKMVIHLK